MAAAGVPVSAIEALGRRAGECNRMLEEGTGAGADFLGWVSLPSSVTETELRRVKDAAEKLRAVADVVVVVGIGGSYLGARAVLEALGYRRFVRDEVAASPDELARAPIVRVVCEPEGTP